MIYFKTFKCSISEEWAVLVHGAGGSSTIWFKQIKMLRKYFNVLLVDLRGHGKSKDFFKGYMDKKYSFEEISGDVIEVLKHLHIKKAHFIGISMGSIIIRTIAELAPEHTKTMVLGGAVTRLNVRSKFLMWGASIVKKILPFIWIYRLYAFILMPRRRNKESRYLFIQQAKHVAHKEFLRWFKLTSQINPLLKYFSEKEIPIPTLYIMGEEDYMFLPQVRMLAEKHAYSQLKILKYCGHVVNIERPTLFNQLSLDFMQKYS